MTTRLSRSAITGSRKAWNVEVRLPFFVVVWKSEATPSGRTRSAPL
jgi:hypothetical protein